MCSVCGAEVSHAVAFWGKAEAETGGDPGERMFGASDLTVRGGMVMPEVC